LSGEPLGEDFAEGDEFHVGEELVEDAVAGHLIKGSGGFLAREPQFTTLCGALAVGKVCDLADLSRSAEQGHGLDTKHGAYTEVGVAGSGASCSISIKLHRGVGEKGHFPAGHINHGIGMFGREHRGDG
jgi:hypothetical protein